MRLTAAQSGAILIREKFLRSEPAASIFILPLRYRPLGEKSWRPGTTENISRSGLLFQAPGNCSSPTRNWKSTSCCRRKLPGSPPPK